MLMNEDLVNVIRQSVVTKLNGKVCPNCDIYRHVLVVRKLALMIVNPNDI